MMKSMKKFVVIGISLIVLTALSVVATAASRYATPAEAVAELTGRDIRSVIAERMETGKTFGTIANEAGVLDEFRSEVLEMRKVALDARVRAGIITQAQADAVLEIIENQMTICDGTGAGCILNGDGCGLGCCSPGLGKGLGIGAGRGAGGGLGLGTGRGLGAGNGRGMGNNSRRIVQ